MELKCQRCGGPFEAKTNRARFCRRTECVRARARDRKRDQRAPGNVRELRTQESPAPVPPVEETVEAATRAKLAEAGRLGTPTGAAALALARRIDQAGLVETGSGLAAVVKELRATLAEALDGSGVKNDPLDELKARREARLASGGS